MPSGFPRRARSLCGALSFAVPLLCCASASSATLHVSPAGDDATAGTTAAPLRTIPAALARAAAGDVVLLGPGVYPQLRDTQARAGRVTIRGASADRTATVLQGAQLYGARNLTLEHLAVRAQIDVGSHPVRKDAQGSEDLVLRDLDVSSTAAVSCIKVRANAARIVIRDNHVHDCWAGIGGTGNATVSHGIEVLDNRIERMTADGMSFGNWHDVRVAGNVITDISDPANEIHNDALQVVGEVSRLVVEDNVLLRSDDQVMILQDVTGPVDDVLFRNNVIGGAGAVAVQTAGLTNTRWIHNTIARSRWSGLWVRGGIRKDADGTVATTPTDTVIVNNVLSGVAFLEGARAATQAGNVVADCTPAQTAPGDRCTTDPGFTDASAFDLSLTPSSPARGFALPAWSVARDCAGTLRGPAPASGALEGPMAGCPVSADGVTAPEPGGETPDPGDGTTAPEPGGGTPDPGEGTTAPGGATDPDGGATPPGSGDGVFVQDGGSATPASGADAGPASPPPTAPGPAAEPDASVLPIGPVQAVMGAATSAVTPPRPTPAAPTPARGGSPSSAATQAAAAAKRARAAKQARAAKRARAAKQARAARERAAKARAKAKATARANARARARTKATARAKARAKAKAEAKAKAKAKTKARTRAQGAA